MTTKKTLCEIRVGFLPPREHHQSGGDGGIERLGGGTVLHNGRDGDALRDGPRHLVGDAVRFVADDHDVGRTEIEGMNVVTLQESA